MTMTLPTHRGKVPVKEQGRRVGDDLIALKVGDQHVRIEDEPVAIGDDRRERMRVYSQPARSRATYSSASP